MQNENILKEYEKQLEIIKYELNVDNIISV